MSCPTVARAQAAPVDYGAPPECPRKEQFDHLVSSRRRSPEKPAPASTARVSIGHDDGLYKATLAVSDDSGRTATREVAAPDCLEAVTAVALITALYLDGVAFALPVDAAPEIAKPPPEPVSAQPPAPSAVAIPREVPTRRPFAKERTWRPFRLGASYNAYQGPGPALMHGAAFSAALDHSTGWATHVAALYGDTGEEPTRLASTRFRLLAVRADVCLGTVRPEFQLLACAAAEAGLVHAQGLASERITSPSSANHAWLASGPQLRAGVALTDRLLLEANGGPMFSLLRHSFVFAQPDDTVHEYPVAGWTAGMGIVVPLL